jgi:glycosyltransferase involved in cell wall biosynthesis
MMHPAESLTIIIPAYNESTSIAAVVEGLRQLRAGYIADVMVVDDGSSDRTAEAARQAGAEVLQHPRNIGYGAAIRTGLRRADTEWVMTFDADGQHSPADVQRLWNARADADMVVGARGGLIHSEYWRMPGKWLLTWTANRLTGRTLPDLNSGLRLMRREIALRYIHLCPAGFSTSTTMTLAFISRGWRVEYVPIQVRSRSGASTVSVATGLETLILVIRLIALFNPLRVFVPASVISAAIGIGWGIPYAWLGRGISIGSMLALVTSVLLFGLGVLCDQISQLRLERHE